MFLTIVGSGGRYFFSWRYDIPISAEETLGSILFLTSWSLNHFFKERISIFTNGCAATEILTNLAINAGSKLFRVTSMRVPDGLCSTTIRWRWTPCSYHKQQLISIIDLLNHYWLVVCRTVYFDIQNYIPKLQCIAPISSPYHNNSLAYHSLLS